MNQIQSIDDERSAAALADLLNGNTRRRPVVVVTTPAGRVEPWIDVARIAQEAGNLAEVFVMRTGDCTWEFSRRMAEGTQVFGGAGRVYPVGHEWASDLKRSPLRFAFSEVDGQGATEELVSDALRMAAAAGLLRTQPTKSLRQVTGVVTALVAKRALVDIGNSMPALIVEELTVEDVSIDRLVTIGQRLEGRLDPDTQRIDVTQSLRSPQDALAAYSVGDVVLAGVTMVRKGKAELVLYPRTSTPAATVTVLRADVTTNPLDDLRTLLTVGEVIPARVVATGPHWAVALHDVDDDEPIVDAPALLAGGPPWLVEEADEPDLDVPEIAAHVLPMPSIAPAPPVEEPVVEPPATPPPLRPTPSIFDRNRPRPSVTAVVASHAVAQPIESTRALLLKIDGLAAEVTGLKREQDDLRAQLRAGVDEREQLRYLLDQAERRANGSEHDLKAARARLRKAGNRKSDVANSAGPQFADREQGFRYLVLTQWATRTLPGEQAARPLPRYMIGPRFLDSLDKLEGIKNEKVADVVFEIVTGLARTNPSREVHRLRTGPGGDDPVRTRDDGSTVCWRASLQVRTPSARRLHYWALPDGEIELARVTTHDDFEA